MPSLNEIIYNIRNSKRGGILSDDDKISDRQLAFIIGTYRARLIKQDLDKGKRPSYANKQTLSVVPVDLQDKSTDCEIPVGCYLLRSVNKLPTPIDLNNGVALFFIGTVDGEESFQFQSESRTRWDRYATYTGKLRKAFLRDGYLFIVNDTVTEEIRVEGIFEQPEQAAAYFKSCGGTETCFTYDSPYPIEESMLPIINEMIFKNEMNLLTVSPQDTSNDSSDRIQQPPETPR